jgi:hypothetical protein
MVEILGLAKVPATAHRQEAGDHRQVKIKE